MSESQMPVITNRDVADKPHGDFWERLAFTYDETARVAKISRGKVIKMVKNHELEAIRIGRCVRIPRHAVLRLCGAKG